MFSKDRREIVHEELGREVVNGGARRDRTADLYNAIVALSQLSYGPEPSAEI